MRQVNDFIRHYLNVRSWKKEVNAKANEIAKEHGYKKNSHAYQLLLQNIANDE